MPAVIQAITWILPARYYVPALHTIFLVGDVWQLLWLYILALLALGALLFGITLRRLRKSLD
jgi:ABC-2 type transport system permease protein